MLAVESASSTSDVTAAQPLVDSPAVVMAPRADGVEIVWSVTAPARGRVEWCLAGEDDAPTGERHLAGCDRYGFVPQGERVLRVRLDGWAPGTSYLVRTITESADNGRREESAWKKVHTLDPHAASTSFVMWNDTHQHAETLTRLDTASPRADLWVWNGDVCNNWTDPAEIVPTLLHPAGRDVTQGRPMAFCWGNHDVRGPYAYQVPRVLATPTGRPFYAVRTGPVAAIFLHTGEDKPDAHPTFDGRVAFEDLRREQADWLAAQVRQPGFADAPYRIVFCHLPLRWVEEPLLTDHDYATGEFDHYARSSRDLWHDTLIAWGAQMIISGHVHRHTWLPATDEFPYAQLTGGGPLSWQATWIEGHANAERLRIAVHRLDASVVREVDVAPTG